MRNEELPPTAIRRSGSSQPPTQVCNNRTAPFVTLRVTLSPKGDSKGLVHTPNLFEYPQGVPNGVPFRGSWQNRRFCLKGREAVDECRLRGENLK